MHLSGAIVLAKTDLDGGVLGEAIAFDDGQRLSVGRAVWTDGRGDRMFSELRGEPVATGRRVVGTITGGTGRYAGVTGDYSLTWQYVAQDVDDVVQGRSVDLRAGVAEGHPVTETAGRRTSHRRARRDCGGDPRDMVHAAAAGADGSGVAALRHLRRRYRFRRGQRAADPDGVCLCRRRRRC